MRTQYDVRIYIQCVKILRLMDTLAGNVFGNERKHLYRCTRLPNLVLNVRFVLGEAAHEATADFQPTLSTITINGQEFNALEFTKETQTSENPQGGQVLVANKDVTAQTVFILAQNDINHGLTGIWGHSSDFGIRLRKGESKQ